MKKLLALIVACLLACAPCALAMEYSGTMYVVGCRTSVSLRAEPDTASEALLQIPRNAEVQVEPYDDTFARVHYQGVSGYVLTEYLNVDHEGDIGMYMWVVNCDAWVSLRAEPRTDAPRVAKVPLGARVWVDSDENGFYGCTYGACEGYILMAYLSEK